MNHGSRLLFATVLFAASSCAKAVPASEPVTIFAAASLTPVVEDLLQSNGDRAQASRLHTAATSTLARQLESGAEADLFLSAHPEWIEWLVERELLDPDSVREIASNELAWIVPADSADSASFEIREGVALELADDARLAVGDPAHVPLGRYTQEALRNLEAWAYLEDRLLPTLDARSALRLVELGEAEAGIVYASDAALSNRVVIRARFPRELHQPIRYQAAARPGASPAALALLDTLSSPAAMPSFRSFGFLPAAP